MCERTKEEVIEIIKEDKVEIDELWNALCRWSGDGEEVIRTNISEEDFREFIRLDGYEVFSKLRAGKIDFSKDYLKFDGYGNFESITYLEIKEFAIDLIEKLEEDEFIEVLDEIEGYL